VHIEVHVFHHYDAQLTEILQGVHTIMATEADLETALTNLQADVTAVVAEIAALKAQVAAGSPVTQAQLDKLAAGFSAVDTSLKAGE
jgi:hypothetical protein